MSENFLKKCVDYGTENVESIVVEDLDALNAVIEFCNDERFLVEPACGATLSLMYSEKVRDRVIGSKVKSVLIVVCGGSGVSLEKVNGWLSSLK